MADLWDNKYLVHVHIGDGVKAVCDIIVVLSFRLLALGCSPLLHRTPTTSTQARWASTAIRYSNQVHSTQPGPAFLTS